MVKLKKAALEKLDKLIARGGAHDDLVRAYAGRMVGELVGLRLSQHEVSHAAMDVGRRRLDELVKGLGKSDPYADVPVAPSKDLITASLDNAKDVVAERVALPSCSRICNSWAHCTCCCSRACCRFRRR